MRQPWDRSADDLRFDIISFFPLRTTIMRGQLRADKNDARSKFVAVNFGDLPRRFAGGQLAVVIPLGLENETAPPRELGDRCVRPEAPDQRLQPMVARGNRRS